MKKQWQKVIAEQEKWRVWPYELALGSWTGSYKINTNSLLEEARIKSSTRGMCDESSLVKWCIRAKFWINWSLLIKLTGSEGRSSITKPVISWRDFSRSLTMLWTNHETKESLFFAGACVPCNRILRDAQTVCSTDIFFVDLPALVSGLRNSHALWNPHKILSSGLNNDYRMF